MKNFIKQIPIFDSKQEFTISAAELSALVRMAEASSTYLPMFEEMIARFIDKGQVSIKYQDTKGNYLTQEQLANYLKNTLDEINDSSIEPTI